MSSSRYLDTAYSSIYDSLIANNIKMNFVRNSEDNRVIYAFNTITFLHNKLDYLFPKFILHDQEPLLFKTQKDVWDELYFNATRLDKRMMILVSEENSDELNAIKSAYDPLVIHWFSNGALALDWYGNQRFALNMDTCLRKKNIERLKYKFSCVNRLTGQGRIYRPVISQFLNENINNKELILSCSTIDPHDGIHVCERYEIALPQRHIALLEKLKDKKDPILVNIPKTDLDFDDKILNLSFDSNRHLFSNVFCHIVTETLFYDRSLHLTEKSLRPMVNRRPFILVGPHHSLRYLKKYGFKTFSDFWDESYDEIADPNERLDAVMELIKRIDSYSFKQMESMLDSMDDILNHNFNHFFNGFGDMIYNELQENVENAIIAYKSSKDKNGWLLERIKVLSEDELRNLIKQCHKAIEYDEKTDRDLQRKHSKQAVLNQDYKFIDEMRVAYLLGHELGFEKDVGKDQILAQLNAWLS